MGCVSVCDMADRLGVSGSDGLRSLTGCYRPDCVVLVSGCRNEVSVLTDKVGRLWRALLRIASGWSSRFWCC